MGNSSLRETTEATQITVFCCCSVLKSKTSFRMIFSMVKKATLQILYLELLQTSIPKMKQLTSTSLVHLMKLQIRMLLKPLYLELIQMMIPKVKHLNSWSLVHLVKLQISRLLGPLNYWIHRHPRRVQKARILPRR